MLAILTAALGFAAPFLPELLKVWSRKIDNAHELKMTQLQMEAADRAATHRLAEVGIQADMNEAMVLRQPTQSFGVSLLDAAKDWNKWLVAPVFYMFALLDFVSGMVRPVITYAAFGFYMSVKWAMFDLATRNGVSAASALLQIWTQDDLAVLTLVLGFWFGARSAKTVFGGSANSINKN